MKELRVGIIGFGERVNGFINNLFDFDLGVRITAVADIRKDQVLKKLADRGIDAGTVKIYSDADEMLDKESLEGVMIGTRCSLHTHMAMKVLKRNLPLFLEKPVATNMVDLLALKNATEQSRSQVVVSFPLRTSTLVQLAKEIVESGKLGTIEHVQAVNNVPYGGVYYHNWYRDETETGGLFLQKATHDFDYVNYLLGFNPVMICAMKSKQIFKGTKAKGLLCKDCDEAETCPEGPFVMKHHKYDKANGDACCFAEDTGNEDSGSAIIRYETGMHVSYSQNFFARHAAAARGARLLGYKGSLEFDWYRNELKVMMHHTPRVETVQMDTSKTSHFGGDKVLAYNFIRVMQGVENSISPMDAGLMSVLMCIRANESAQTNTFRDIAWE